MKSYPKINLFLKITGKRDNYHTIISRFIKIKSFYDEIEFLPSQKGFGIEGEFSCSMESNTIYKVLEELKKSTTDGRVEKFLSSHKVVVEKKIKEGSGLGGGSSNAATVLLAVNSELHLGLSLKELADIGVRVGADLPFFIYGFDSANVSGIGEIVEEFDETLPEFRVVTPEVFCSTVDVYRCFRDSFYKESDEEDWRGLRSVDVLERFSALDCNDLLEPALKLYPSLKEFVDKGMYFSGSGSSFFEVDR